MLSTSPITGGGRHAPMRCLRRPAGAARTHTPHRYMKKLYRIAGQDYCRHHIVSPAVAAGVIIEIRPSGSPAVAVSRE